MDNSTVPFEDKFTRLEYDFMSCSLILIMVAAILGNLVISAVILRNRKMWTDTNIFVMNLAAGDIAVSLICMPIPLYTTIQGKWTFDHNGTLCVINGFLNSLFFIATIFTHTIISIERFVYIVKPLNRSLTRRRALYMIIAVWFTSAAISLGPILGWGAYEYNKTTLQCGFRFPENLSETLYIAMLSFLGFLIPINIMTYNYIRIYVTVHKHGKRMKINAIHAGKEVVALQKQILMTFFIALMAFVILWAPFFSLIAIAVIVPDRTKLPHGLGVAAYWCGFSNSACNPFILGIRSQRFREGIREIFYSPGYLYRLFVKWLSVCSKQGDTHIENRTDYPEKDWIQVVPLQQSYEMNESADLAENTGQRNSEGVSEHGNQTQETAMNTSFSSENFNFSRNDGDARTVPGMSSDHQQPSNLQSLTSRYNVSFIESHM